MTLYWLSCNGDAPQGPLLLSQLRIMRDQGRISAEDFVCVDGTEDWQPVASVFGEEALGAEAVAPAAPKPILPHFNRGGWMPKDSVPEEERPFMKVMIVAAILVCLCVVLYLTLAPMLKPAKPADRNLVQREAVLHWAVVTFRDPGAQLLEIGQPLGWDEGDLRLVRVKTEGTVHTYVIQFNWGTLQVTPWWTPSEWQERYSNTDKAVTYADTAQAIFGASDRRLPNAEAGASPSDQGASKP
jgi:GYF domain 2